MRCNVSPSRLLPFSVSGMLNVAYDVLTLICIAFSECVRQKRTVNIRRQAIVL